MKMHLINLSISVLRARTAFSSNERQEGARNVPRQLETQVQIDSGPFHESGMRPPAMALQTGVAESDAHIRSMYDDLHVGIQMLKITT